MLHHEARIKKKPIPSWLEQGEPLPQFAFFWLSVCLEGRGFVHISYKA